MLLFFNILALIATACSEDNSENNSNATQFADVDGVKVTGKAGSYHFSVTLSNPDKGCEQYADWWEVISESGELLYRRILTHSHVDEQPFTRTGSPVNIQPDEAIWVRGHMNNTGYGGAVMKGSVSNGFAATDMPEGFATELENESPLPDGCRF